MTAQELLSKLRAKGVEVSASGDDRLVIDAPRGTINEELRSSLAAHKAELLELLKKQNTVASLPQDLVPEPPTVTSRPVSSPIPELVPEPPPVPSRPFSSPQLPVTSVEDKTVAASVAEEIT